ncbi:MAG: nitroreductase [Clostridia bacterium]|nr:nitroreductase [Clostridia bacterium]
MSNQVLECLKSRRSIKKYKDTPVEREKLELILEAGTFAPSGKNKQAAVMVCVTDKEQVALLSKINAEVLGVNSDPFYGAPCVVVVFADSEMFTYIEDGSLVMGNMLHAAHSLGVDSCWIHRARQMFETEEGKELMKKWGLGENYKGIGNCILGYADCEYPKASPRKDGYIIFD